MGLRIFRNKEILVLSFLFSCLYLLINFYFLDDHQNWGGDFAHYLINARNLLLDRPYQFQLESLPLVSPGYPSFLALLTSVFGSSFFVYKIPNILGWLLFSLFSFWLLRQQKLDKVHAFFIFILLLGLRYIFSFKNMIIPDILFALNTVIVLGLFERSKEKNPKIGLGLVLALFVCFGSILKPANVALVAALCIFYLIRRSVLMLILIGGSQIILIIVQQFWLGSNSISNHVSIAGRVSGAKSSLVNFEFIFSFIYQSLMQLSQVLIGLGNLVLPQNFFELARPNRLYPEVFFSLVILGILWLGIKARYRESSRSLFYGLFLVLYVAMLSLWHTFLDLRYLLPVLPVAILFFYSGVVPFLKKVPFLKNTIMGWPKKKYLPLVCILYFIWSNLSHTHYGKVNHDLNRISTSREIKDVYQWILKNGEEKTPPAFFKPRVMSYFTDRPSLGIRSKGRINQFLKQGKSYYFVVNKNYELYNFSIAHQQGKLVYENALYGIIHFQPQNY